MTTNYAKHLTTTPQSEQADRRQVKNSAGGYTFQLSPEKQLDRWLILGSEGGTYYATEQKLTLENARCIQACLDADGPKTVARIVEISEAGRAPKNDPAIFALAIAAAHPDIATRAAAIAAMPKVCRTGTMLFQWVNAVNSMRGWGGGLRRAVAAWYNDRSPHSLLNQLTKYRSRAIGDNTWTHRDLLRLAHVKAELPTHQAALRWAVGADLGARTVAPKKDSGRPERTYDAVEVDDYLTAFDELQHADEKRTIALIAEHGFTHEMINTSHKNSAAVWEALLQKMPMTAMIRNLGKMSEVGLLKPLSSASKLVTDRLGDQEELRKARIHPIAVLSALMTYQQGHGVRGSLKWDAVPTVVSALDAAFYLAFGNIDPSGKKTLIALDVSGSMGGGEIAGVPGLSPRVASAAMAMVTMRTEPEWHAVAFTSSHGRGGLWGGDAALTPLKINPTMSLAEVVRAVSSMPFGGTDCALPMLYAAKQGLNVEAFQVWTDNETWAGGIHPHQALKQYRDKSGTQATSAVIGCTATAFTIADPTDPGSLDVVGFDTATPNLLAAFAKGWQ